MVQNGKNLTLSEKIAATSDTERGQCVAFIAEKHFDTCNETLGLSQTAATTLTVAIAKFLYNKLASGNETRSRFTDPTNSVLMTFLCNASPVEDSVKSQCLRIFDETVHYLTRDEARVPEEIGDGSTRKVRL